jgi:hypothetical protein
VNNEWERIERKQLWLNVKVLSQYMFGETEENQKKPQLG